MYTYTPEILAAIAHTYYSMGEDVASLEYRIDFDIALKEIDSELRDLVIGDVAGADLPKENRLNEAYVLMCEVLNGKGT